MKARTRSTPKHPIPQEVQKREEDKAEQQREEKVNPRLIRTTTDARQMRLQLIKARRFGEPLETAVFSLEGLPDSGLEPIDVPRRLQTISQKELEGYVNAERNYRVAKADFERKRGNLALRLMLGCEAKSERFKVKLDADGRIILKETDRASAGPWKQTSRS